MSSVIPREKTTSQYSCQIIDQNKQGVAASAISTATLTLYDRLTKTILNGRIGQNILNTNDVTIDGSGNLVWKIRPLDNIIIDDTLDIEVHMALFQITWNGGNDGANWSVEIPVMNLEKVS